MTDNPTGNSDPDDGGDDPSRAEVVPPPVPTGSSPTEVLSPELAEQFEACRVGLRKFLSGKLPQPADVEDCLQSVGMALLKNAKPIPRAAIRAWLFRVASNEAALWWRRRSVAERASSRIAALHEDQLTQFELPSRASELTETRKRVEEAIQTLPPESQTIIRMRTHDDMTFQQIADRLGQPLGTVLTRMRRAADRLRRELSDESPGN
ncbi:MAG: sigma-70 family RNA polymerase sigma factor [Planctomycetota bacterium]